MPSLTSPVGARASFGPLLVLVLACTSAFGCSKLIDEKRCAELLDHYTDRLIDQSRPRATAGEREQLRSRTRAKALLDPEFRACPQRVSEEAFDCAVRASSSDEIERCLM